MTVLPSPAPVTPSELSGCRWRSVLRRAAPAGLVHPEVTVEQLAAILQRYADYKGYDIDETVRLYADAVVSQWAVDNVRWAAAEGLLRDGRSTNGTLVATRAEIAYALYGFMVNVAK